MTGIFIFFLCRSSKIYDISAASADCVRHWKPQKSIAWDVPTDTPSSLDGFCERENPMKMDDWLVVWNMFYFPIYWESSSQLTNIFQRGSNHQPDDDWGYPSVFWFPWDSPVRSRDLGWTNDGFTKQKRKKIMQYSVCIRLYKIWYHA